MREIGYEFNPLITSNAGGVLNWPEYNTIGSGSKLLFDSALMFGSHKFSKKEKLEHYVTIGHIPEIENWYALSLRERGAIMKDRLPPDFFERHFEL